MPSRRDPRRDPRRRAGAAMLAAGLLFGAAPAAACDVAILLAIDVSSSVDADEYRLEQFGHVAAFRDPEVIDAILALDGVEVALMDWSGMPQQEIRAPWTRLADADDIAGFANRLAGIERRHAEYATAVGAALLFMERAWSAEALGCARRVIDISGDGASNTGNRVAPPRARLLAAGVTLNALVIDGSDPPPSAFYRDEVIGGPGAFMEVVERFEDYAAAFRRKLLRELRLDLAAAAP